MTNMFVGRLIKLLLTLGIGNVAVKLSLTFGKRANFGLSQKFV